MISVRASSGSRVMIAAALVLAFPIAALAALLPAEKCEAAKNKTAGAYYSCREKAEATAIAKALPMPDYSKCSSKFDTSWDKAETTGAGACPDNVTLTADMNAYLAAQAAEAASVIAGASIPDCAGDLATCEGDLTTCDSDLLICVAQPVGQVHETGQTICYNEGGTVIACPGTGQDGELQKGIANSFTDNGDGTVTDNLSGLMWEKLSDDGSIHDWNTTYDWTTAVTTKMAALNSAVFAGHNDWRLPNRHELLTLANLGAVNPATFSAFNAACAPGCTVTTCSCTQWSYSYYWSSSTYHLGPPAAWLVYFSTGGTSTNGKTLDNYVRAVRAGS
ncbi:MAG: DUF1566 domain-containing protein [Deltaproteobacteria bacterium]|nr:DUF1566 domain-containing protein [Deltaproteobacteria bacterium]